jgi:cytochrome c-type biogenesis protein CcmF
MFIWQAGNGAEPVALVPSRRTYTARGTVTTEAAIHTVGLSQMYLTIGDNRPDGGIVVHAYFKPLVTLIWIGAIIMAIAGLVSLSDRRLRIGAPKKKTRRAADGSESPAGTQAA